MWAMSLWLFARAAPAIRSLAYFVIGQSLVECPTSSPCKRCNKVFFVVGGLYHAPILFLCHPLDPTTWGSRDSEGDIAWLLLIGYVVDLQMLLTPLLTGMVLLYSPGP